MTTKIENNVIKLMLPTDYQEVDSEDVEEFLILYPANERMVENFEYFHGQLRAKLIPRSVSYSHIKPDYYTGEQILRAFSQLGYLVTGLAMKDIHYEDLDSICIPIYKEKIKNLQCFYLNYEMRFKSKIYLSKTNEFQITLKKVLNSYSKLIVEMEARIDNLFVASAKFIYK